MSLCSTSQLWLPHPALCIVLPECFQGLCVWSGAMGSKSSKLQNVVDHDNNPADLVTEGPAQWLSPSLLALEGFPVSRGANHYSNIKSMSAALTFGSHSSF